MVLCLHLFSIELYILGELIHILKCDFLKAVFLYRKIPKWNNFRFRKWDLIQHGCSTMWLGGVPLYKWKVGNQRWVRCLSWLCKLPSMSECTFLWSIPLVITESVPKSGFVTLT